MTQMVYFMSGLSGPSDEIIKQVAKMIYDFIKFVLNNKPDKIKRNVTKLPDLL